MKNPFMAESSYGFLSPAGAGVSVVVKAQQTPLSKDFPFSAKISVIRDCDFIKRQLFVNQL